MTRIGVDVGGTFTDLVSVGERGALTVRKVSSTPDDPAIGLWAAVDRLETPVAALVHGTTIATNALLERRGARVVLVSTEGFEDLLWLRRQDRSDLYDLLRDHPPPLVGRDDVIGARERMGPEGVLLALSTAEVTRVVEAVAARAPEAVAVSLLFAFRFPEHEEMLAEAVRARLPGVDVVTSSEVAPLFREYERTSTAVAEATLRPRVSAYVERLAAEAAARDVGSVRVMASSGGSLRPAGAAARASSLALSGPAGGVVGARAVAHSVGIADLLTIDMGGTSADASLLLGGEPLHEPWGRVAGLPLLLPSIVIETVSAGGGSVGWVDSGGALKVGPESSGADPGPASYGRGGTEAAVTDALLALGWLDPTHPLADDVRLDPERARQALEPLARRAGLSLAAVAWGMLEVAAAAMARALKQVSVRRGIDPRGLALLPFGGAGPLFGCLLAEELGIGTVVVPPHPGVLSALGLAVASERVDVAASVHRSLEAVDRKDLAAWCGDLAQAVRADLPEAEVQALADCRFAGQGYELILPVPGGPDDLRRAFVAAHRERYGHGDMSGRVELVALRAVGVRPAPTLTWNTRTDARAGPRTATLGWRGSLVDAPRWPLEGLTPGTAVSGPAVFDGADATAFVAPGWRAVVHSSGALMVSRI